MLMPHAWDPVDGTLIQFAMSPYHAGLFLTLSERYFMPVAQVARSLRPLM